VQCIIEDIKAIYAINTRLQLQPRRTAKYCGIGKRSKNERAKLHKLFRQTFRKGVFEYYQSAHMQKAIQLQREHQLTVSEVGYQPGFTNLSHFSGVFEQHTGMKPKRYSASRK
jgi:AraC-like DNA-binding protein